MVKRVCATAWLVLCGLLMIAGTTMGSDTNSFDLDWYGYFKLDGSWDQNLTSHGNFALWLQQQNTESDDEQFNMTANQTRFGIKLKGNGLEDATLTGNLEFDLYAGVSGGKVAENKAMVQLRHAYFDLNMGKTSLIAGQTWDIIAPLNPPQLNYGAFLGSGNIGYRRPQVRLSHTLPAGEKSSVTVAGGMFRTIGSDLTPTFSLATGEASEGSDDGTDAGIPSFQGLMDIKSTLSNKSAVRFGVSGLWGQMKAETNLGNSEKYESWAVAGHFKFTTPQGHGVAGELFQGTNLGSYFGGILNNSTIDGLDAVGGWASAWVKVSPKVKFSGGIGFDDPSDEDINSGSRSRNRSIFGQLSYQIVKPVTLGLEISDWKTNYLNADAVSGMRAQTSFVMNF